MEDLIHPYFPGLRESRATLLSKLLGELRSLLGVRAALPGGGVSSQPLDPLPGPSSHAKKDQRCHEPAPGQAGLWELFPIWICFPSSASAL